MNEFGVYTLNDYFFIEVKSTRDNNILKYFKIVGNEKIIDIYERNLDYNGRNYGDREGLDRYYESYRSVIETGYDNDIDSTRKPGSITEEYDWLFTGEYGKRLNKGKSNGKISETTKGLDNSSFSLYENIAPLIKAAKKNM